MPASFLPAGWRRWSVLAPFILVAGSLSGCFSAKDPDEHCDDISEYQASRSVPGIVVPDGLSPPSRASGYVVPSATNGDTAPETAVPVQQGAACLARPPDFFRKDPAPAAQ